MPAGYHEDAKSKQLSWNLALTVTVTEAFILRPNLEEDGGALQSRSGQFVSRYPYVDRTFSVDIETCLSYAAVSGLSVGSLFHAGAAATV